MTVLGTLHAPDTLAAALQTNAILVDPPGLLNLDHAKLKLHL